MPSRIEDASGRIVWWASPIHSYGLVEVDATSEIAFHLRFPGHYQDVDTGLFYNRFRYYDPTLGRYLQSDPLGTAGGTNLYAYVPNPLVHVDVLGLNGDHLTPNTEASHTFDTEKVPGNQSAQMKGGSDEVPNGVKNAPIHSKYPDGTIVYEGQQPGKVRGPDPGAKGAPHTQLQWDTTNNRIYKAREYGENDIPIRDIDFTHPTFPNGKLRPDHHAPEQHRYVPNVPGKPKAGFKRGTGEPLVMP
ncbi:RHS repeat-associated core domain-containing protein [Cystobacter fuscus]